MKAFNKVILTLITLVCGLPLFGQSNIWINGTVYYEIDSLQCGVPFATVKVYSDSIHTELAYFTVCGPLGNYTIKPYDHTKKYYIVTEAPHFSTREVRISPIPEIWDGKPFSGNATTNICMDTVSTPKQLKTSILSKENFPEKTGNLYDLILSIDNVNNESGEWFTSDERGVLFCLNGNVITDEKTKAFNQIPTNVIDKITIYETCSESLYGMVIDVYLTIGSKASKPNYHLSESQFFY